MMGLFGRDDGIDFEIEGDYQTLRPHFNWDPEGDDRSDKLGNILQLVCEKSVQIERDFKELAERVAEDGRYTEAGVREKVTNLAREMLSENPADDDGGRFLQLREKIRRVAGPARKELKELHETVLPDPPENAGLAQEESDRQRYLASLEGTEHMRTARAWALSDDPTKVRAVFRGDPRMSGFAAPESRERLRSQRLQYLHGSRVDELQALDGMARRAEHNVKQARSVLAKYAKAGGREGSGAAA